jgi:hypothetical protein
LLPSPPPFRRSRSFEKWVSRSPWGVQLGRSAISVSRLACAENFGTEGMATLVAALDGCQRWKGSLSPQAELLFQGERAKERWTNLDCIDEFHWNLILTAGIIWHVFKGEIAVLGAWT